MRKHIPNLSTSLNLLSGCIACVMAFEGAYLWVVVWVIIGSVFDFFDGFLARILKAPSAIGKELDSLADMISFGMAPGLVVFRYLSDNMTGITPIDIINPYIPYLAFLIVVFSALRLAKFNTDERQTSSFIGLSTPPNALFWISYIYGVSQLNEQGIVPLLTIPLILIFSLLLVAEIPTFSLKVKGAQFKGNELRYILIVFMIIAFIILGIPGIAAGILFYILLSIISPLLGIKAD